MEVRMKKSLCVAAAFAAFVAVAAGAAPAAQGPELGSIMREKLARSQKILEAVVTSNWYDLETQSRALAQVTNDPRWQVLKSPEYRDHTQKFVRAVDDLHRAAVQRDLDEAPKAYVAVTLACVDCHRYLARARIAK
jgi:cytochrome c556